MKHTEFDKNFEDGADISASLDLSTATRLNQTPKRVNVDFPQWMVQSLDTEAQKLGVSRQSLIKFWIAERIGSERPIG